MDDSHASFDVRFRRESPTPFAHGLERIPVRGIRWTAWDTSNPRGDEPFGSVPDFLGRTGTSEDDTTNRQMVRQAGRPKYLAKRNLRLGYCFLRRLSGQPWHRGGGGTRSAKH